MTTTLTLLPLKAVPNPPAAGSVRVVRPAQAQPNRRRPSPAGRRAGTPRPASCERSYPPDLRGSCLTPRGRVVVGLAWLVLGVVAAVPIVRMDPDLPEQPAVTTTMVVDQGDTLWALAREVDPAADPRTIVDAIVELNGLRTGADIHPGDVLVVPAAG
jgi:nucleoid-associated protein YgaU